MPKLGFIHHSQKYSLRRASYYFFSQKGQWAYLGLYSPFSKIFFLFRPLLDFIHAFYSLWAFGIPPNRYFFAHDLTYLLGLSWLPINIYIKVETSCWNAWGLAMWHSKFPFSLFNLFYIKFFNYNSIIYSNLFLLLHIWPKVDNDQTIVIS